MKNDCNNKTTHCAHKPCKKATNNLYFLSVFRCSGSCNTSTITYLPACLPVTPSRSIHAYSLSPFRAFILQKPHVTRRIRNALHAIYIALVVHWLARYLSSCLPHACNGTPSEFLFMNEMNFSTDIAWHKYNLCSLVCLHVRAHACIFS